MCTFVHWKLTESNKQNKTGHQEWVTFLSCRLVSGFNPKQSKHKQKWCFCVALGTNVHTCFLQKKNPVQEKSKLWLSYLVLPSRFPLVFTSTAFKPTTLINSYRLNLILVKKVAVQELRNKKCIVSSFEWTFSSRFQHHMNVAEVGSLFWWMAGALLQAPNTSITVNVTVFNGSTFSFFVFSVLQPTCSWVELCQNSFVTASPHFNHLYSLHPF